MEFAVWTNLFLTPLTWLSRSAGSSLQGAQPEILSHNGTRGLGLHGCTWRLECGIMENLMVFWTAKSGEKSLQHLIPELEVADKAQSSFVSFENLVKIS